MIYLSTGNIYVYIKNSKEKKMVETERGRKKGASIIQRFCCCCWMYVVSLPLKHEKIFIKKKKRNPNGKQEKATTPHPIPIQIT